MLPHARIFSLPRYLCTLAVSAAARVTGGVRPLLELLTYLVLLELWSSLFIAVSFSSLSLAVAAYQTFGYACILPVTGGLWLLQWREAEHEAR